MPKSNLTAALKTVDGLIEAKRLIIWIKGRKLSFLVDALSAAINGDTIQIEAEGIFEKATPSRPRSSRRGR